MLLVDLVEPIELPNHLIRFRRHILLSAPEAGMGLNSFEQIFCAPVVQEKDSLPEAPQGRRAKFIARCIALAYVVGQTWSHVTVAAITTMPPNFMMYARVVIMTSLSLYSCMPYSKSVMASLLSISCALSALRPSR